MNTESKTPRCDELVERTKPMTWQISYERFHDLARTLELETVALKAELQTARLVKWNEANRHATDLTRVTAERDEAHATLAAITPTLLKGRGGWTHNEIVGTVCEWFNELAALRARVAELERWEQAALIQEQNAGRWAEKCQHAEQRVAELVPALRRAAFLFRDLGRTQEADEFAARARAEPATPAKHPDTVLHERMLAAVPKDAEALPPISAARKQGGANE